MSNAVTVEPLPAMQVVPQYPGNRSHECLVANPEIKPEKKRGDQHHDRGAVDFLLARPGYAFHLRAHIGEIVSYLHPSALLNADRLAHNSLCLPRKPASAENSGRGGGI